jgi:hypothetical protein
MPATAGRTSLAGLAHAVETGLKGGGDGAYFGEMVDVTAKE